MPKQQLTLEQRLSSKKISIERFQRESLSLIAAGFTNNQAEKLIIRQNSKPDIEFILVNMPVLITEPFNLSHEQIVKIGTNYKSRQIFITFQDKFQNLIKIGITKEQLIRIASHDGGSRNIKALLSSFHTIKDFGFSTEQIVEMIGHPVGYKNIATIEKYYSLLVTKGFNPETIVYLVGCYNGSKNIDNLLVEDAANDLLQFFNNAQSISQTSGTFFAEEPPAKRLRATEKDNTPEHPQQTTKNK